MKVINFELSKKLNDLGLLDNIETEYGYYYTSDNGYMITETEYDGNKIVGQDFKTLTLEEAIEFLPLQIYNNIDDDGTYAQLRLNVNPVGALPYYFTYYDIEAGRDMGPCDEFEDIMGAVEKMLNWLIEEEYLLDNNLLTK